MISGSTTWFVSPLVVIVASPAVSTLRSQSTLVAYGSGSTNLSTTRSAATGAAYLIPERRPVRRIAAAYQCLQWPSASCGVEQVFVERTDRVPDCNHHVAGHCLMLADQPGGPTEPTGPRPRDFKASALLCFAAFLWDDWTAPLMTFVSIATGPARTR